MKLPLLFLLNIIFVVAIWHMDVNHNLDRKGTRRTRGVFKISPEAGFRYSQYALLATIFLLDLVFLVL